MLTKISKANFEIYEQDVTDLLKELIKNKEDLKAKIKEMKERVNEEKTYIFGEVLDNKMISFSWAYKRNLNKSERIHISYFIVDKHHRSKGISRKMLTNLIKEAEKIGINKIDLNVSTENNHAINVYNKLGFEPEKILMTKNIGGEQRV